MKHDQRGNVVPLRHREDQIPRNKVGDPAFTRLEDILTLFDPDEVTAMVNRYLYNMEYQKSWQRKRLRAEAERLRPIKDELKRRFNVTYLNATEEQLRLVSESLTKE
jgi:hypothetical protein